jgi:sugar phosphate permease
MATIQVLRIIPHQRWWRILPVTIVVYLFSFMDRANIGFAMAGGMNESLHITAAMAGLAAGMLYIGYIFFQIPGGHIAAKGHAKIFITVAILVWGAAATCTGLVTAKWQLLLVRFILGLAEGGTWPAMLVLIANWFPNEERGRANSLFIMSNSIAFAITGPLSGWIITFFGWRSVFFVEGAVTMALVALWWPLIEEKPEDAKWLSEAERDYLVGNAKEEQSKVQNTGAPVSYAAILRDLNIWKLSLLYFLAQMGNIGFIMWLPTIIKVLTKSGMAKVGMLSSLPYLASVVGLYAVGYFSDRSGNRKLYTGLPILGFALCFFLSAQTRNIVWVSFAFLTCCGFFQVSYQGVFWSIPPLLFPKNIAGGARGIINALGNIGGLVGPWLVGWMITVSHKTNGGIYVLSFSLLLAFLVSFTLPASLNNTTRPSVTRS